MTSVIPTDDKRHYLRTSNAAILLSAMVSTAKRTALEELVAQSLATKPDYGVDAPAVMRNFFVFGTLCLLFAIFAPHIVHLGPVAINARSFYWLAGFLIAEGFLFL